MVVNMSLNEEAQRYYDDLPPHAKTRKGAFYISELLKENNIINDIPENMPLVRDSGLWALFDEGMNEMLLKQKTNELFFDFIKRCINLYSAN